jgi:hypothetical protein
MGKVESAGYAMPLPPNQSFHNGDPGTSGTLARGASPVHPPGNTEFHLAHPNNGFLSMAGQGRPADMDGSNAAFKFNVQNAQMPQPPSAIQPGVGAVSVRPFASPNGATPIARIPDRPTIPKGR